MREAMTLHRASPSCAGCHAKMDPIGFSLENFDAAGRWRDIDGSGKVIDASTQLVDGTKFTGVEGLKGIILKNPERFVSAVSEKLLMYGIGRNVQYFDAPPSAPSCATRPRRTTPSPRWWRAWSNPNPSKCALHCLVRNQ